jgi:hypothetical protein
MNLKVTTDFRIGGLLVSEELIVPELGTGSNR